MTSRKVLGWILITLLVIAMVYALITSLGVVEFLRGLGISILLVAYIGLIVYLFDE